MVNVLDSLSWERDESANQSALTLPVTKMKIMANKFIRRIPQFCTKEWQDVWNSCEGNKLHAIYPNVGKIPH